MGRLLRAAHQGGGAREHVRQAQLRALLAPSLPALRVTPPEPPCTLTLLVCLLCLLPWLCPRGCFLSVRLSALTLCCALATCWRGTKTCTCCLRDTSWRDRAGRTSRQLCPMAPRTHTHTAARRQQQPRWRLRRLQPPPATAVAAAAARGLLRGCCTVTPPSLLLTQSLGLTMGALG